MKNLEVRLCEDCKEKLMDNDEVWMGVVNLNGEQYSLTIKFSKECGTFEV